MQLPQSNLGSFWIFFVSLATFLTTVFWMFVGWRAMRAHERIADTLDERIPGGS